MESQKPVDSSGHTRGMAFDATVLTPRLAHLKKIPVSLDRLTLLAGIMRPDIVHDPVHNKLVSRGNQTPEQRGVIVRFGRRPGPYGTVRA
jgi:hypothetical protein